MKVLLLSCSTGEGHNHCAQAVLDALNRRGHETEFLDMLHFFGTPGPVSIEKVLNTISTRAPEVFGLMYRAGEMYSATRITSPVYLANTRYAKQLGAFIERQEYDAVVCSHLFPMETLTYLRRHDTLKPLCCGILSDYTCIPFLSETELDLWFLPHPEVLEECVRAGMPAQKLYSTGMPVAQVFCGVMERGAARKLLDLPEDRRIYLVMTGGIGCGDAVSLCRALLKVPGDDSLLCVLAGRNDELRENLREAFPEGDRVRAIPFTRQVAEYMSAADVLLSKAGGISSSEAAVRGVPLVHTMAIPGVETRNAEFFHEHGFSLFARSEDEAARYADRLVYDAAAAERMRRAQRDGIPTDGAERIAAQLEASVALRAGDGESVSERGDTGNA